MEDLDALLADLQSSVPGNRQPQYNTSNVNYGDSSGYGSLRGKPAPPVVHQEHYSVTEKRPSASPPRNVGGYNGLVTGSGQSYSHQNHNSLGRSGGGYNGSSLQPNSKNLSELDSLLEDLSNARYNSSYEKKENIVPTSYNSISKYNTYNSSDERPTIDSLLSEMDNVANYAVPNGLTKSPTPGRHVSITVRETKTESLGPEGPVGLIDKEIVQHKETYLSNQTAPSGYASSATKELDDLMASLSDFKVNNGSNHHHQTVTDYAKPNKGVSHLTQTITETTTSTVLEDNEPDQLDSMLGSLQANMSRQGVNTVQKGCCNGCEKPIVGQVITALGKTWHPEHFTCNHCNQELGTRNFFERDGYPYCEPDYHNLFSPRCAYCNGAILDKCVTALDKTWHTEHFFCAQCGQQFGEDGFHERDGKPYCRNDYFEMFAPKCNGCNRAIMENYISALNSQWHPDCFVCRDCRRPFQGGSFFDHEGLPYCETHYHAKRGSLCAGCSKPITGRCITAMFKKFHPEHFVCAFCLKQLNKVLKGSEMSDKPDTSFIPDLPKGPLCRYRNRAKFDWKQLKMIFERETDLRIKYKVWKVLENDPLFSKQPNFLSTDEQKHLCAMQVNRMPQLDLIPEEIEKKTFGEKTKFLMSINEALHIYSPSLSVKIALGVGLFNNAIRAMGTERHMKYYDAAWSRELITCLAITEVAHGSNTKNIRTTAKYDPETQEFIINTPDFEAAKCWVGNLGKTATIAMTFANLYTADGENHGLHGFLIPIRDPKTLQAYPGVLVGDIGEKIGLNGIDNGFVMFSNYRIPRENLLNRTGDVSPEGVYESVFSEPGKVLGAALESFSAGRIGITQESANTLASAAVIAVRYAALRKQFGPEKDGPEMAIIEYQLQQWRIFPYLAAACVLKVAVAELTETYLEVIARSQKDSNGFELLTQIVSEIHAVISSSKPLITWTARDAIQEAREACGGHGYLKASKLGDLRNDHDPSVTYEGDNNVLGQQASNWLLRQWNGVVESPVGTANFLKNRNEILQLTFDSVLGKSPIESMDFALHCYEWMLCYLLDMTSKRIDVDIKSGVHRFDARNNSQVYGARDITLAYAEYFALCRFKECYQRLNVTIGLNKVLEILFDVYSLWCIDRHMTTFYVGEFAKSASFAETIRKRLLSKCGELKDSAVSVSDALAPPDFALNSIIAKSDGLLYENLQSQFMTNEGVFERPTWWKDIIITPKKSKL